MAKFCTKIKHAPGTVIELDGEAFTFDSKGIGTLTTDNPAVIERLRQIPEGFEEVEAEAEADAAAPGAFVLTSGDGSSLDLSTLDDEKLRAFVVEHELRVHGKAKGDTLRKAIVEAIKAKATPPAA